MRILLAWAWMYPWRTFGLCLLLGFVVLNLLAYRHARAFTRFCPEGDGRGESPEALSLLAKVRLLLGGVALPRPCPDRTPADVGLPFDRLLSTVKARFAGLGVPSFPGAQLLVFWGGWQHGFNGFRHNPVDYARDVSCPVLLLHGRQDPRVSAEQVEEVHANLAGEKE